MLLNWNEYTSEETKMMPRMDAATTATVAKTAIKPVTVVNTHTQTATHNETLAHSTMHEGGAIGFEFEMGAARIRVDDKK